MSTDDWTYLSGSLFSPSRVEQITEISPTLLRKWVQLHFKEAEAEGPWWKQAGAGVRRFTWCGLQLLQFFREVSADLGSATFLSKTLEKGIGDQAEERVDDVAVGLKHSNVFATDHRDRSTGDLFAFCRLGHAKGNHFYTGSATGLGRVLSSRENPRLYIYNLSAMQRALAKQAVQLGVGEGTARPSAGRLPR